MILLLRYGLSQVRAYVAGILKDAKLGPSDPESAAALGARLGEAGAKGSLEGAGSDADTAGMVGAFANACACRTRGCPKCG